MSGPFDLSDAPAYRRWRDGKLAAAPSRIEELVVEVDDPRKLTDQEHAAILDRIRRANMAVYASRAGDDPDKDIPRRLGERFGLTRLDANLLSDDDGITSVTVAEGGGMKGEFIPYTNRPIRWHTDGYYNTELLQAFLLHCVVSAASGGENRLLDPELVYIALRDENPEHARALMAPDVMTIPAREDENGVARAAQSGPVFAVDSTGNLVTRYTARTVSIEWKAGAATAAALDAMNRVLETSPFVLRARLEPGMGVLCNNVLHDRSAFTDTPGRKRLIYRARYLDRIAGTNLGTAA